MKTKMIMAMMMAACSWGQAATVSDVTARQRWPWNGLVDIDYTITGDDTAGMTVDLSVKDNNTGIIYTPTNLLQIPPAVEGRHRVTWDTAADNLDLISSNMAVTVSLGNFVSANMTNALYYVIDLSGGPDAPYWPVTTLNYAPKGGWSDEYKTTKLVLRRIEPGAISGINEGVVCTNTDISVYLSTIGRSETYYEIDKYKAFSEITIEHPYYIGVFEVTKGQYQLMKGGQNVDKTMRPQRASYSDLRGKNLGSGYPDVFDVDGQSIIAVLREKTGLTTLDLPTEMQWEYACRAGVKEDYNNGGFSVQYNLAQVGRYWGNGNDKRGDPSLTSDTLVGSYTSNHWGLYDMHGNVEEWCLDKGCFRNSDRYNVTYRAVRGGGTNVYDYRSGARRFESPTANRGFRLCCSSM